MKIEKYSELWVLHLVSCNQSVRINPLRYTAPKWYKKLYQLAKRGWLKKKRFSCADFEFRLTDDGRENMKRLTREHREEQEQ